MPSNNKKNDPVNRASLGRDSIIVYLRQFLIFCRRPEIEQDDGEKDIEADNVGDISERPLENPSPSTK